MSILSKIGGQASYANVMATVAVFVALGGTSYAVATGSIDSRELKNNTVRSKDIRNNNVRGRDIRNGTLTGRDVGANKLTGADILESSLGTVPNASHASSADSATSATNAVNARTALAAGSATIATELQFVGKAVWNSGGSSEEFGDLAGGECAEQAVEADSQPGDTVLGTVNGGSAPNPLPAGLTATFLLDDDNVILRVCNPSDSPIPSACGGFPCFLLDWQFVVLRPAPD
jgi:hypothetical protein